MLRVQRGRRLRERRRRAPHGRGGVLPAGLADRAGRPGHRHRGRVSSPSPGWSRTTSRST
ncbi:hypothetical protein G5V59_26690 [Nocardioides sp. W3-2-3]|uniref:hypothetical protein n=1 Tax=Nocardioides convexus TaxID=2712224 RepID=UPI0024183945|nr:hypothetical protein [Nocardioides convexus]NHA01987.1 hypothetical protein [Nocardioides convexus]